MLIPIDTNNAKSVSESQNYISYDSFCFMLWRYDELDHSLRIRRSKTKAVVAALHFMAELVQLFTSGRFSKNLKVEPKA